MADEWAERPPPIDNAVNLRHARNAAKCGTFRAIMFYRTSFSKMKPFWKMQSVYKTYPPPVKGHTDAGTADDGDR